MAFDFTVAWQHSVIPNKKDNLIKRFTFLNASLWAGELCSTCLKSLDDLKRGLFVLFCG
jgi:hypothetical protein